MEYTIIIEKNKNGWYTGQCEQIPEAISQGATIDELKENMADAIKMVLDYKKEETRRKYQSTSVTLKLPSKTGEFDKRTNRRRRVESAIPGARVIELVPDAFGTGR
ncbi:MAG: type II toxin-antitoxin system HicB family antitoxin [Bacteroidales bacterium]|nr:type II toxin-antitoxin system HicB family antitoxin [Bacteroidales bacterium]